MCNYNENCLKRRPIGPKQGSALEGVHFREGFQETLEKHVSEAEHGSRNIPFTTNLISLLISKLFQRSIKTGKLFFKKTKFLSDVSTSP